MSAIRNVTYPVRYLSGKILTIIILFFFSTAAHAQDEHFSTLLGSLAFENGIDVAVKNDYVYATDFAGFKIISISDPSSPQEVGYIETPGTCNKLKVKDNYLFAGDGSEGIRIYDITLPDQPSLINIIEDSLTVSDFDVQDNYLSMVSWGGDAPNDASKLSIINISDIENPVKVGQVGKSTGYYFLKVFSSDTLLAVAMLYSIKIFNISDPGNPIELSQIDGGYQILDLFIDGNYLYVAWSGWGFRIFDITNPSAPVTMGHYNFGLDYGYIAKGVYMEDNFAYVAVRKSGLRILDVTDKFHPVQVAQNLLVKVWYSYTAGEGTGIYVKDRIAYIVDKTYGLFIASNEYESISGTEDNEEYIKEFKLYQNYPNPFNPVTKIQYSIPDAGIVGVRRALPVKIVIYDILGNEVLTLVNESKEPGLYEVKFDASYLPSGLYIYRINVGDEYRAGRKMLLLK